MEAGRWQRSCTMERSTLQNEAEPGCPGSVGQLPSGLGAAEGSPFGFGLAPLLAAFTDMQPVCQPEQIITAMPAPMQNSTLFDGTEVIHFYSSF